MTYVINRRKETAHRICGLPFYAMNTQWLLCAIFLTFWNIFAQYSKSVLHFSPLCDKIVSTGPGQTTKKESLYLKGIFAFLLVVVIAATALNITAFAYSDFNEGTYQGKHWTARQTVTKTSVDTTFSRPGEGTLTLVHTIDYHKTADPDSKYTTTGAGTAPNYTYLWFFCRSTYTVDGASGICRIKGKVVSSLTAKP